MGEPSLEVRIRTLTPLWTGGLDGTMDRIHETSASASETPGCAMRARCSAQQGGGEGFG